MSELQRKVLELLSLMSGEAVAKVLTDYHGLQLIDEGFARHLLRHLVEEGVCGYDDVGLDNE